MLKHQLSGEALVDLVRVGERALLASLLLDGDEVHQETKADDENYLNAVIDAVERAMREGVDPRFVSRSARQAAAEAKARAGDAARAADARSRRLDGAATRAAARRAANELALEEADARRASEDATAAARAALEALHETEIRIVKSDASAALVRAGRARAVADRERERLFAARAELERLRAEAEVEAVFPVLPDDGTVWHGDTLDEDGKGADGMPPDLGRVRNFSLERPGCGRIEWSVPGHEITDVSTLDLKERLRWYGAGTLTASTGVANFGSGCWNVHLARAKNASLSFFLGRI
jgi:hypothetical protein